MTQQEDLTESLTQAINDFYRRTDELYHDIAKRMGLADCAFEILYSLMIYDGLTQTQLQMAGFSSKQTISSSVKRLKQAGLVEGRADGRANRIFLTEAGRAFAERRIRPVLDAERSAAAIFGPAQQKAIIKNIERYTEALASRFEALDI